jgi:hypothetical protein
VDRALLAFAVLASDLFLFYTVIIMVVVDVDVVAAVVAYFPLGGHLWSVSWRTTV